MACSGEQAISICALPRKRGLLCRLRSACAPRYLSWNNLLGVVTLQLKIFMVLVILAFLGVIVGGFLVFSNFLNREKERAKRFRNRHSKKPD